MAILKIYGEIVNGEESAILSWCGVENVTFTEVRDFILSLPEEEKNIDILINSVGGSVSDGWAIYDALRSSGKEITATVEGVCASMASIVLMAAPKEKRFGAEHATYLLHEPRYPVICDATTDVLRDKYNELSIEVRRFIELYAERTDLDASQVAELLKEERQLTSAEALEMGIIGVINTPNTAILTQNNITMKKNALARLLERAKAMLEGIAELRLTTTTGVELVVETDADDPKVGDKASPDGEHVLEDGRVIEVENGVITEIKEKEAPDEELTENERAMAETIEQLTAKVSELQETINTLTASQKSDEEVAILETVAKAGGAEWLKSAAVSTRVATQRALNDTTQAVRVSKIEMELEKLKKK